jgi:alpha-glucosidase (family GH31 glycosyl hydrolase)
LHEKAIEKGYAVLSAYGKPPVDDAVIDLSNPEAVRWYQEKLAKLLRMGVGIFTADFGEAAPLTGIYHARASSFLEHNLYPLRYIKAVADVTREITGNGAIYARSAWAGSQRYPLHWGGDAEITDGAMAGTLRGGLSLGLCGFSFWSHFIGGFSQTSPPDLYRRWLTFGVLCSHGRCHGAPPPSRGSTAKNSLMTSGAPSSSDTGSCPTSTPRPSSPPRTATPCCEDIRRRRVAPHHRRRSTRGYAREGRRGDTARQARPEYRPHGLG